MDSRPSWLTSASSMLTSGTNWPTGEYGTLPRPFRIFLLSGPNFLPSHRPLPEEMLFYARSDTHFLLFIYDNLRNLLIQHSNSAESVQQVLVASSRTALQVYVKELYDAEHGLGAFGWKAFLSKFGAYGQVPGEETDKRKAILVAMHVWRDRVAREMDESTA